MSSIYSWDQSESTLTATTTSPVSSLDAVLFHSAGDARKRQTKVGVIGSIMSVSTTSSTAVNLPPNGLSVLTSPSTTAWILQDPTAAGMVKIIVNTTTTSTNNVITTQGATILTTAAATATSVTIQGAGAGFVELTALSTSLWAITSKGGTIATS